MRCYLAAPWDVRHVLPGIADRFEAAGHLITEKWWHHPDVPGYPMQEDNAELETQALRDFFGVVEADAFVLINCGSSEGKNVELGIALTMCHQVIIVGPRSNIFHYMPGVRFVESVDEALEVLAA